MCVAAPGLLAGMQFVLSAASAVVGYQAQMAQYEAQMAQWKANQEAADLAARQRYQSINNSLASEQQKVTAEMVDAQREGLRARSRARAAAGEAGVAGLSVDHLLSDFYFQEYDYLSRLETNYDTAFMAYEDEKFENYDRAIARKNSIPYPTKPSFAGAAIRIMSGGLDAFSSYRGGRYGAIA